MTTLQQLSLLDLQLAPAHNDTETSILAAVAAIPNITPQKRRILAYLDECGERGSTQDQCSIALILPINTCNPRFNEMADDHWIEPTLDTRKTRYGRLARVYVISEKGREALAVARGDDDANGEGHPVDRHLEAGAGDGQAPAGRELE